MRQKLAEITELGTQYQDAEGPIMVAIGQPVRLPDGTYRASVSIGSHISDAKIAGETPLDSYWHATQFAMSHLHMLFSEGRVVLSREATEAIDNWHRLRSAENR